MCDQRASDATQLSIPGTCNLLRRMARNPGANAAEYL